ncbi:MAG: tripartite tricarboxylate transporter substrate binding protein [Burkholderiales bacterium]|nr:tripartite tricarboxylate transporter substrate binding protein [Burkholderiales bacterium]
MRAERSFFICGFIVLLLIIGFGKAHAWKPERPIEFVVPSAPGGGFDKTMRLIEKISREEKLLDVPVTIVNRSGGGGNVALTYLTSRPGDGHTLMVSSTALLANHIVGRSKLTHRDLTPVANMFSDYISAIVVASSPIRDSRVFINQLKKSSDSISFGFCCALGGGNHLAAAMIVKALGGDVRKMRTVVFKGAGETTSAVLGGHIDVASNAASNALGPILDGKMKVIGVAAPKRLGGPLKDVPTWREQNIDAVMALWRNLVAPKGLSTEQIAFWEQLLYKVSQSKQWQEELENNLWNDTFMRSSEMSRYLDEQYEILSSLLTDVGLKK